MWHTLEYSSEKIDSLKSEMQRLQDEAARLLFEAKNMEREAQEREAIGSTYLFQDMRHQGESGDNFISRICRTLHY